MNKVLKFLGLRPNAEFIEMEKEFNAKIRVAVDDALAEERRYFDAELQALKTRGLLDSERDPFFSPFFESYDNINAGPTLKGKEKAKYKNVAEGTWATYGLSPFQDPNSEQTLDKLRLQQAAAMYQWVNYPIARSEIENIKRYALGRGLKITCTIPEIARVIKNFLSVNQFDRRNKESFRMYLIEGETFMAFYDNYDETSFDKEVDSPLLVRTFPSSEIVDIEYDSEDRETVLSYKREIMGEGKPKYYLDVSHPFGDEEVLGLPTTMNRSLSDYVGDAEEPRVIFFKNGPMYDSRGRVFLEPVLRWNRVAVDFLYTRSRLNHLRSKIFLVETRMGSTGNKVSSAPTATERMPAGGTNLIETSDRKFRIIEPKTGADDAETDYRMLLYMIGSALSMPLHVLQVNAENENYASIKEAGTPFVNMIADVQDDWKDKIDGVIQYLLHTCVRVGILEKEYTVELISSDALREIEDYVDERRANGDSESDIKEAVDKLLAKEKTTKKVKTINAPVDIIFPNIVKLDIDKNTRSIISQVEAGLTSEYTGRIALGRDPEVERERVSIETKAREEALEKRVAKFNQGGPDFSTTDGPREKTKLPVKDPNDPEDKAEKS